jgi:hypothetical protein
VWLIVASCAVAVAGERRHWPSLAQLVVWIPLLPSGLGWVQSVPPLCGSRLARIVSRALWHSWDFGRLLIVDRMTLVVPR